MFAVSTRGNDDLSKMGQDSRRKTGALFIVIAFQTFDKTICLLTQAINSIRT